MDWSQSSLSCHAPQNAATRYAVPAAKGSGGETLPENATRLTADRATGQTNALHRAEGDVIVERNNETLNADWVEYDQRTEEVVAGDDFTLTRADGQTVKGKHLRYNLAKKVGNAQESAFEAVHEGRRLQGVSGELSLEDKNHSRMKNVKFNTCAAGDHSWYIQAAELKNNQTTGIGVAKHAKLVFGGVPILYTPWADFPTRGNRKSGLLVPTLKVGSDGTELALPYYLNLAPNYDATLTPSVITARGAALGGELRYLQAQYSGSLNGRYLPHDRRSPYNNRYEIKWQHRHQINPQWRGGIDLNQVSDDDYYRDFYGRYDIAANTHLNRRAWLAHQSQPVWGEPVRTQIVVQKYQTLTDSAGKKDKPYALLPEISSQWHKNHGKARYDFTAQLTRFDHSRKQSGTRAVVYPSVKWDWGNRWAHVRPKVGVHATQYWLKKHSGSQERRETRVLPMVNVDSGVVFERELTLNRQRYVQTLEPRLFYNYIATQSQNHLPNFDSGSTDFSYDQLFRENIYSGNDRINSSNSLAFGLQTRVLNAHNGAEKFRAGIGQKHYFNTDDVLLNGSLEKTPRKRSDIAAFAGGQIHKNWFVDSHVHYNESAKQTQNWAAGVRYNPQAGKVFSARFKYGRNEEIYTGYYEKLKQIDLAMQYPLNPNLYAVARLNYNIAPRTPLEQTIGLEYKNGCGCWGASLVAQRYITGLNQYKNAVYFTLQLKDLSSLGSDTYEKLRLGIPGYHKTNNVNTR
ncbi:LPS-assembly protein LptD [Alysiella filiformis]|nr:LPS-assembly protein LptD [Alysiella filiformis]